MTISDRPARREEIIGHRHVSGAYLAQLARRRGSRLATFDQAMAKLHGDVVDLIPASDG